MKGKVQTLSHSFISLITNSSWILEWVRISYYCSIQSSGSLDSRGPSSEKYLVLYRSRFLVTKWCYHVQTYVEPKPALQILSVFWQFLELLVCWWKFTSVMILTCARCFTQVKVALLSGADSKGHSHTFSSRTFEEMSFHMPMNDGMTRRAKGWTKCWLKLKCSSFCGQCYEIHFKWLLKKIKFQGSKSIVSVKSCIASVWVTSVRAIHE